MAEPFLGEIKIFGFGFAPRGWALANGQLLPINQNQALFSLLGTNYGGDGRVNFGLPNLQGRVALSAGAHVLGESGGEQTHTLLPAEMAAHTHPVACNNGNGTQASPLGNFWAQDSNGSAVYSPSANTPLAQGSIGNTGGSQPHSNLMPFLTLNFCIAMVGIFPSQN